MRQFIKAILGGLVFFNVTLIYAGVAQHPICHSRRIDPYTVYVNPAPSIQSQREWFQKMGTDTKYAVAFTRCLAKAFKVHDLDQVGFRLMLGKDAFGQFTLIMREPLHKVFRQPISPTMPYDAADLFMYRVNKVDPSLTHRTKHTVTLKNWEADYMLAPLGQYVSIVDFSLKAKPGEVCHFWHVLNDMINWLEKQQVRFEMYTLAGTASGQHYGHFIWYIDDVTYNDGDPF